MPRTVESLSLQARDTAEMPMSFSFMAACRLWIKPHANAPSIYPQYTIAIHALQEFIERNVDIQQIGAKKVGASIASLAPT